MSRYKIYTVDIQGYSVYAKWSPSAGPTKNSIQLIPNKPLPVYFKKLIYFNTTILRQIYKNIKGTSIILFLFTTEVPIEIIIHLILKKLKKLY